MADKVLFWFRRSKPFSFKKKEQKRRQRVVCEQGIVFAAEIWYNCLSIRIFRRWPESEVCGVYRKLMRLLAPRVWLHFAVMLIFCGVTYLLAGWEIAVAELAIVAVLCVAFLASGLRRQKAAENYLRGILDNMDQTTRDSAFNCPLPLVMFRPDTDEVVWSNDRFLRLTGEWRGQVTVYTGY